MCYTPSMATETPKSGDRSPLPAGISIFALQGFHSRFGEGTYPHQTAKDGRLLDEVRASREAITKAVKIGAEPRERPSILTGTRRGLLENYAAFEAIAQRWQSPLDALAWINYQYFGETIGRPVTMEDVKNLSLIGIYATSFLLKKSDGYAPTNQLPNVVADTLKISIGIQMAAIHLSETTQNANVANMTDAVEREKLLVSIDYKACPAPLPMIRSALEALIERKGNAKASEMATILSPEDVGALQKYITYHSEYTRVTDELFTEIFELLEGIDQVDPSEKQGYFDQRKDAYDKIVQYYLEPIQQVQDEINGVLGRAIADAPPVTAEELIKNEHITFSDFATS